MPIRYEIDRERGLVRTRCIGYVTFAEAVGHFRELENDESLPARVDVLLDLTEMESVPESDQLRSVAKEVEAMRKTVEWGSCAIVADRDILFGMSRVFHAFAESYFANAIVVRDLETAERWLASRGPAGRGA